MISGVFIYNHKGDCMISRIYRDDITYVRPVRVFSLVPAQPPVSSVFFRRSVVDAFRVNVIHSRAGVRSPVTNIDRATYFHVKRGNMYLMAVTRQNANAALIFEFIG